MTRQLLGSSLLALALAWPAAVTLPSLSATAQTSALSSPMPTDISAQRRGPARRSMAVGGPRNVAPRRGVAMGPAVHPGVRPVVRPGFRPVVGPGRWARPAHYHWRPGGAILAGAAIGFVVAGTALAWAGPPPAPGMCWYYTDPTRTRGFWDYCP